MLSVVQSVDLIERTVLVAERAADAIHAYLLVKERSAVLGPELLILTLPDNVCLLNLTVGKLASVSEMTIASREPVSAHLSFVLICIDLIFLFLLRLILAALRVASLFGVAGYKRSNCRASGERLLTIDRLSRVRLHRKRGGIEGLRSWVERLSSSKGIGRNEFFYCARHKWLSGSCGLQ